MEEQEKTMKFANPIHASLAAIHAREAALSRDTYGPADSTIDSAALATQRHATADRTRQDRLREAGDALKACRLGQEASNLLHSNANETIMNDCRYMVSALISRLSDGSDEPRYAAAVTAREALGKLWAVL